MSRREDVNRTHVSRVAPYWNLSDPIPTELQRRGVIVSLTQWLFVIQVKSYTSTVRNANGSYFSALLLLLFLLG